MRPVLTILQFVVVFGVFVGVAIYAGKAADSLSQVRVHQLAMVRR